MLGSNSYPVIANIPKLYIVKCISLTVHVRVRVCVCKLLYVHVVHVLKVDSARPTVCVCVCVAAHLQGLVGGGVELRLGHELLLGLLHAQVIQPLTVPGHTSLVRQTSTPAVLYLLAFQPQWYLGGWN